ncbi:MAG: GGDEF domain-containing protein [Sedimentibacter sp.]|uniref:GGDEF domain-containing protein n=1 Tax=Sedimentibacter sp. TaxID=1960295 RepID=UPI003158F26C
MNIKSFLNKLNYIIKKDKKDNIVREINATNFARMKLVLIVFLMVELLFILFNDVPYMINSSSEVVWNHNGFLVLHLLIAFVCSAGLILIETLNRHEKHRFENMRKFLIPVLTVLLLSLLAVINGLDQLLHSNISSVFIANLIIFSAVILLGFPLNTVVYSIPFIIYLGGLIIFQQDAGLLISNAVNGLIFLVAVIIISTVIYDNHYERMVENMVLEETILKLNYLSNHDPLTELLNRRCFGEKVTEKMKIINETSNSSALILMDVDYFKQVNDNFGHPSGDIVLKEVGNILMKHIKTNDLATRWGGEEFLIFLSEVTIKEAYEAADTIRMTIQNNAIFTDKFQINITASFGVSLLQGNSSNAFDISYKAADAALYQAKNQGRNIVVVASTD